MTKTKTASKDKDAKTLEALVKDLEQLIETMENGDVGLEDLITHYEKGAQLLKQCEKQLSLAELKILKLKEGTEDTLEPFALEE